MPATVTYLPRPVLPATPDPLPPACYAGLAEIAEDRGLPLLAETIRGLARAEAARPAATPEAARP
jgi:hypothetical protein